MKWTKDTVSNQPDDTTIDAIVLAITRDIKPEYIAISVPMDPTSDYPNPPAPRTAEAFTQKWSDSIHAHGAKVLWRGTWSGIEGIYSFPQKVGVNRFPTGTAASAATDGDSTWLGKTYNYIINHPTFFKDGDIWAPLPERTEGIFNDATSFLPSTGAGLQANYAQFFIDLHTISAAAFSAINKNVITGLSTQNFSEINSGWMYQSVINNAGYTVVDHYGITHTPEEMESDLRRIYAERGNTKIFLQEWGDYWDSNMPDQQRMSYLTSMYTMWQKLIDEHILAGFNYWGAWGGNGEGVVDQVGSMFQANARGMLLAQFFAYQLTNPQTPTTTPTSTPTQTPPTPPAPPVTPPTPSTPPITPATPPATTTEPTVTPPTSVPPTPPAPPTPVSGTTTTTQSPAAPAAPENTALPTPPTAPVATPVTSNPAGPSIAPVTHSQPTTITAAPTLKNTALRLKTPVAPTVAEPTVEPEPQKTGRSFEEQVTFRSILEDMFGTTNTVKVKGYSFDNRLPSRIYDNLASLASAHRIPALRVIDMLLVLVSIGLFSRVPKTFKLFFEPVEEEKDLFDIKARQAHQYGV